MLEADQSVAGPGDPHAAGLPGHAGPVLRDLWLGPEGWLSCIRRALQRWQPPPGRLVVLLPQARLIPIARALWVQHARPGDALPRFETTQTWSLRLGAWVPGEDDLSGDPATDALTARRLLAAAGLAARQGELAEQVLECAQLLAPVAAAVPPAERPAWWRATQARLAPCFDERLQRVEAAVSGIALAWVASSAYPTDVLWDDLACGDAHAVLVLAGFQQDPLTVALAADTRRWPQRIEVVPWAPPQTDLTQAAATEWVCADDRDQEVDAVVARVLQRVREGRVPVAVPALDRMLVRRVQAALAERGVAVRDDSGWKLSTTRRAAVLLSLLRAAAADASAEEVVEALQGLGWPDAPLADMDALMRRQGAARWDDWTPADPDPHVAEWLGRARELRRLLRGPHALSEWRRRIWLALEVQGHGAEWLQDPAGLQIAQALHGEWPAESGLPAGTDPWPGDSLSSPAREPRWSLADLVRWVRDTLEATPWRPPVSASDRPPVVILPLPQMLGQPFGAVVLAGCDEIQLPAVPRPPGLWTPSQRAALGLTDATQLGDILRAAWNWALLQSGVTVVWRTHDEQGDPLQPSPLVLAGMRRTGAQAQTLAQPASAGLAGRLLAPVGTARPRPVAPGRVSASGYEDLRRCPYRFFALRMLRLRDEGDIDEPPGQREFGLWLHDVLRAYHEDPAAESEDAAAAHARLERIAEQRSRGYTPVAEDFLPYLSGWPGLRDAYIAWWLQQRESGCGQVQSEVSLQCVHPGDAALRLVGQIDRIDRVTPPQGGAGATVRLIDYKTEARPRTTARFRRPFEDTQLAFYAALLQGARPDAAVAADGSALPVQAAYLSLAPPRQAREEGQLGDKALTPLPDFEAARDALLSGLAHDFARLRQGHALQALGRAPACDHCDARGLCRRDFWTPEAGA